MQSLCEPVLVGTGLWYLIETRLAMLNLVHCKVFRGVWRVARASLLDSNWPGTLARVGHVGECHRRLLPEAEVEMRANLVQI